jgi:hypothetical protein
MPSGVFHVGEPIGDKRPRVALGLRIGAKGSKMNISSADRWGGESAADARRPSAQGCRIEISIKKTATLNKNC